MNFTEFAQTHALDILAAVKSAFIEDLNHQTDVTASLIPQEQTAKARIITREDATIAGIPWLIESFKHIDPKLEVKLLTQDGDSIEAGSTIAEINGYARSILTAERTALNFLQTLSAVATCTKQFTNKIAHTQCRLLDTRKTIPGLRLAQKYAVLCGGGKNHRMGLYDAFLIKENHIAACGSISHAIERARHLFPKLPVEIEVESLTELKQAIEVQADIIMLDNFSIKMLRDAVSMRDKLLTTSREDKSYPKFEASGNVNLHTIANIAETGVDFISVGALTKNVRAIDLSLRLIE